MPAGALVLMAVSRAPTSPPWRIRAASLTCRWLKAEMTDGKVTALTMRMMRITTRSSIRVNPRRPVSRPPSINRPRTFMVMSPRCRGWTAGSGY